MLTFSFIFRGIHTILKEFSSLINKLQQILPTVYANHSNIDFDVQNEFDYPNNMICKNQN